MNHGLTKKSKRGQIRFCPMAVSATSSSLSYDVFISFRGEDTRLGFTGFLYETLSDRGIRTFFDHHAAEEPIKAIEESKVSIIVFSENYASSTYCLDELVSIIDSYTKNNNNNKKKDNNHCRLVFPVFYHVDPSHVRNQSGVYAQAMNVHKENSFDSEKLMKWKDALKQAANFSGCHFKHGWVSIIFSILFWINSLFAAYSTNAYHD
jgi:hypothetical protein